MAISEEQCLAVLRDLLQRVPVNTYTEDALAWYADVAGAVAAYSPVEAVTFNGLVASVANLGVMNTVAVNRRDQSCTEFAMRARALFRRLQLQTNGFVTAQFEPGQIYDYFEEIRRLLAASTREVVFIDPWLNSEFVTRYLPQVPDQVAVKLLTARGQAAALRVALDLFIQQANRQVELRVYPNGQLHDRHLIVDGVDVYQSGASFKDGARNSPTSINQIVDAAPEMIAAHMVRWNGGTPV